MNYSDHARMYLTTFVAQSPMLLVCLLACVVILVKWKEASRGAIWALAGFGLTFLLGMVIPVVQTSVQIWSMETSQTVADRSTLFVGLSLLWSVLRAVSYLLLLVAVFAGRATPLAPAQPPLRQH